MMSHGGAEKKLYRAKAQMQGHPTGAKSLGDGFGVGTATHPVPMKATPITECSPGLGAKTIAHPFKKGKPKI